MIKNQFLSGLVLFTFFMVTNLCMASSALLKSDSTITKYDTSYYTNLNNQFILRLFTFFKSNNIDVRKGDDEVRYRPNGNFNLGIGFNYKFLGLGISFGIPTTKSNKEKYGNTQRLDVQLSVVSKAFGIDGFLQAYKGYYIANPNDIAKWDESYQPQLPDMQVLTLGINAFYIVNHKKFSYRAAFIGNQIQQKSAGSITAGLFGAYDRVRTDNGFLPEEMTDSSKVEFDLKSFEAYTVGLSAGYMYNFVLRKGFFISLAAVPGGGYRKISVENIDNEKSIKEKFAFHLLGKIAIGWNKNGYFINFNTLFNVRNYRFDEYELSMSTEQLRLTFGIRFQTKASKKRGQYY